MYFVEEQLYSDPKAFRREVDRDWGLSGGRDWGLVSPRRAAEGNGTFCDGESWDEDLSG